MAELCERVRDEIRTIAEREDIPYFIAAQRARVLVNGRPATAADLDKVFPISGATLRRIRDGTRCPQRDTSQ
jgi:hypothetical protein